MGEKGNAYRLLWRSLKETDHMKCLDFEERIRLESL
jgi:hypothetical protein